MGKLRTLIVHIANAKTNSDLARIECKCKYTEKDLPMLNGFLEDAINDESYERACVIRDEIRKVEGNINKINTQQHGA